MGPEFEELYERYEAEGRARKTVKAHKLWWAIVDSQMETGVPYMLYKVIIDSHEKLQYCTSRIHSKNKLCTLIYYAN